MNEEDPHAHPEIIEVDLSLCPRCGKAHRLEYKRFELGDKDCTHWATCPETGEPLLLDARQKREKEKPDKFMVKFVGPATKATQPPNPNYPNGIDVRPDVPTGTPLCEAALPYPAPGVGGWQVQCRECMANIGCTTAGRADDPRSISVPCANKHNS